MSRSGAQYLLPGQGGGPTFLRSGQFYHPDGFLTSGTIANPTDQVMRGARFSVPQDGMSIAQLAIRTTVAAAAGGVFRMGVYRDSSGVWGSLLVDAGTVDVTTTSPVVLTLTVNQAIPKGVYWLVGAPQGAPVTGATYNSVATAAATAGVATYQTINRINLISAAIGAAGLPDPAPADTGTVTTPWDIQVKVA